MGSNAFLEGFLMISTPLTIVFILALAALVLLLMFLKKKFKMSFAKRVILGMVLGLVLGLVIQAAAGFPAKPTDVVFIKEATTWYTLLGNGFIDLIRMLVIPLVMVSIIHVIINMEHGANIGKMTRNAIVVTMLFVAVSVVVGLVVGVLFQVGSGMSAGEGTAEIKEVKNIVSTLRALIPANPVGAMVDLNVIGLVIFSAFFGLAARKMDKKYHDVVKPFFDLINALHKIIISIAMTIIKIMPYAVIPLLANTIAQRGLESILQVGIFIVALYVAVAVMFVIHIVVLLCCKVNPLTYFKKGSAAMVMAFTSRSSVGTLPMTIETLTAKMGVSQGTASFVASFGTTAGMQGCAGVFPALLVVFVCHLGSIPLDVTMIIMSIIVITIGSLGIAGIPGTATMAASVALSGTGLASFFPLISPILAIDPLIDMGRTLLNVAGSMVNAIVVDKTMGTFDEARFNDMSAGAAVGEADEV